jgi:hypothetical protein
MPLVGNTIFDCDPGVPISSPAGANSFARGQTRHWMSIALVTAFANKFAPTARATDGNPPA